MLNNLSVLTPHEIKYYDNAFYDYPSANLNNFITIDDFKEILVNTKKFPEAMINNFCEQIKRKLKEGTMNLDELLLSKSDYFEYLESLMVEFEKSLNEKDPEIRELFYLLAGEFDTLSKSKLVNIITAFDLPIRLDEFFAPIGKKEELSFQDFCSLFKSKSAHNEMFLKTFTSSFHNISPLDIESSDNSLFPIKVQHK